MPGGGAGGGHEHDSIKTRSVFTRFSGQFFFTFS